MSDSPEARHSFRTRLYESYATLHSGGANQASTALIYRRDIRPHLGSDRDARIVDIGCGQGALVRELQRDGWATAEGVDVSPEQVAIAKASGVLHIRHGDFHEELTNNGSRYACVIATDVLEHQDKAEVLATLDAAIASLRPGGIFIARVPNAVSPFAGRIQYGDFTHETAFTPRSVAQICGAVGFEAVEVFSCPPIAHGLVSHLRVVLWRVLEATFRLALAVETGALHGHIVTQNLTFVARKRDAAAVAQRHSRES